MGTASQMQNFLDQTDSLWASNPLVGKVGGAFYLDGNPARRAGDDAAIHHHQPAALGDVCRGPALYRHRAGAARRGHWRLALQARKVVELASKLAQCALTAVSSPTRWASPTSISAPSRATSRAT